MIPFNKPYLTGKETAYIQEAVMSGHLSGNGMFTKRCHRFFQDQFGFKKCLLTTSCSDALEMAALLLDVKEGDEVIVPSYTFVSTANAFVLRGAKIKFADSQSDHPNIDPAEIRRLITDKTRAVVVVHYAGMACAMDEIMAMSKEFGFKVVEDAAQAITSMYKDQYLGSIGHLSTFSFHETKNIISGEGGMLVVNDPSLVDRAEIIWEKGTNRAAFFKGEVDKYGWVDVGSSFLPSEVTAAFLYAQLENMERIQRRRQDIWERYYDGLSFLGADYLPKVPDHSVQNYHMFYLICMTGEERDALIAHMRKSGCHPVFHYMSLHRSAFFKGQYHGQPLPNSDRFETCLVRLPFFYELGEDQQKIIEAVRSFYQ